jgi:hypothetical protein
MAAAVGVAEACCPGLSCAHAASSEEFASSASGLPEIAQPTGLPSNRSMTGER